MTARSPKRREPHYRAGEHRFVKDRCPGCGRTRVMREDRDLCGACADGERPRLQHAMKPALDVLVAAAVASFGRAELRYLAERFADASQAEGDGGPS